MNFHEREVIDNQLEWNRLAGLQQAMGLQGQFSGMSNCYQNQSLYRESAGDRRLREMVTAFNWDRAFDLVYFDQFFAGFPEV